MYNTSDFEAHLGYIIPQTLKLAMGFGTPGVKSGYRVLILAVQSTSTCSRPTFSRYITYRIKTEDKLVDKPEDKLVDKPEDKH